jgi:hypothetical protein
MSRFTDLFQPKPEPEVTPVIEKKEVVAEAPAPVVAEVPKVTVRKKS